MTVDNLNSFFKKIENNSPEIFDIKFNGFSIWAIVKAPLYSIIFNKITSDNKSLKSNYFFFFFLSFKYIFNSILYKTKWLIDTFILKKNSKYKVLIALFGRRRLNIGELRNLEPFSDEIVLNTDLDILCVESNKGVSPVVNVPYVPEYRENIFKSPSLSALIKSYFICFFCEDEIYKIKEILVRNYISNDGFNKIIDNIFNSKIIKKQVFQFINEFYSSKFILQNMSLDAIILVSSDGYSGTIAAAKFLNILTIEQQHGVIDKYHPQYNWPIYMRERKNELNIPDYIFMFGYYWQDILLSNKFWSVDNLIVTGNSGFELQRNSFKSLLSSNKKICVLYTAAKPCRKDAINFLDNFLQKMSSKKIPLNLIIKIHPAEDSEYEHYNQLAIKYPDICSVYFHKDFSLFYLFSLCHFHITVFSATALESLSLKIPTGILNIKEKDILVNDTNKKYFEIIEDSAHLVSIIESINNKKLKMFFLRNSILILFIQ